MKIRTRLTLYFTLLITVLIVTRSVITYEAIYQSNEKEFYDRLHSKALTTAFRLLKVEEVDSAFLKIIDRAQYDLLDNENISVYDDTEREIYSNNDTVNFKTSKALFDEIREKKEIRYREGPYKIIAFYYTDKVNKIVVTAGAIDHRGEGLLIQIRIILIATLLASILVMSVIGWLLIGRALRPISSIINKVATFSPVENSERLPELSENDEIAALIRTFNNLFDKLEDSFKLQKNFVSNVSHELNNPLTKIKSQLEVSLMQNRDSAFYEQTMQSILEDVNELTDLIQDLLKFSRLSSEPFAVSNAVRIDELLFDIRDQVLAHFPAYHISINFTDLPQSERPLIIMANKHLMITALKNIIENACKFSADRSAALNLVISGESVILFISDKGPGIPPEDIPNIFKLFYRSPSMEAVKGYGIGLALAQRILIAHGFPVKVESEPGKGTTFIISFSN